MLKSLMSVLLISSLCFVGCSSADKKPAETAEEAYKKAQEHEKDEDYIQAIERYSEVKNKFPYSRLATESELAIADIHFKEEDFPESQVAYSTFKDLHPRHDKIAYVTYQLGLSYFNQLPDSIDRDLSIATEAIETFTEVVQKYASSTFAKDANKKRKQALKMLGEKEMYIANFYFIRSKWDSALKRYNGVLKDHLNLGFEEQAMARVYITQKKLGKQDDASKALAEFKAKFPNSSEIFVSEQEIK